MKSVRILHPFTAGAAGLKEAEIPAIHSQPHARAMECLLQEGGFTGSMDYFTSRWFAYQTKSANLNWRFFPVSRKLNGDHNKWRKQWSEECLKSYRNTPPDVTVINMSALSSPFSFEISKLILAKGKRYIAMLGGQHYNNVDWAQEYYHKAHHILVHTAAQKEAMGKMEMFRNLEIRVFPLGIDCNIFSPVIRSQKEESNYSPELLYVGRIVEWKRVHLAIEALQKLVQNGFQSAKLTLIGPITSPEYFTMLYAKIEQYHLKDSVFYLGSVPHEELPQYFKKADLLLLPSEKETFGMVMVESMGCGTPVAAMNEPGGPSEVITHGVNGILSTPENYSSDILSYFQNQALILTMREKARLKILNNYSVDLTKQALKESVNSAFCIDDRNG